MIYIFLINLNIYYLFFKLDITSYAPYETAKNHDFSQI